MRHKLCVASFLTLLTIPAVAQKHDLSLGSDQQALAITRPTPLPLNDSPTPNSTKVQCGNYWVYYVGTGTPEPQPLFTKLEKKDLASLPLEMRLKTTKGGAGLYRGRITANDCDFTINLEGHENSTFFLVPFFQPQEPILTEPAPTTCLNGCSPCDALAQYRITYDLSTQEICAVQRSKKGEWQTAGSKGVRPKVGAFLDVKYVNVNAIRDSVSIEYQYENMNLENSEEFLGAILATTSTTAGTAAVPKAKPTEPADQDGKGLANGFALDDNDAVVEALDAIPVLNTSLNEWADKADMDTPPLTLSDLKKRTDELLNGLVGLDLQKADYKTQLKDLFDLSESLSKLSGDEIELHDGKSITKEEFNTKMTQAKEVLPWMEQSYRKLLARAELGSLQTIAERFKAELRVAEAADVTPDRVMLKLTLDSILQTELPARAGVPANMYERLRKVVADGKITGLLDDAQGKDYDKRLEDLMHDYDKMVKYRVFALAPIQVQDYDVIKLQFKCNGRPLNDAAYEIPTRGGWKLDFSTGVVVTGLRDHSYFYDDVRNETLTTQGSDGADSLVTRTYATVRESEKNKLALNFGVMMHAYSRSGRYVNYGPTIGFVVGTTGMRVLGGGSLLLGKRQRLVLSGGIAIGYVDKLQDGRETGSEIELSDTEQSGAVPVQRDMDTSWFAGVSWNFGGARLTR
jgi:hypothetical protein